MLNYEYEPCSSCGKKVHGIVIWTKTGHIKVCSSWCYVICLIKYGIDEDNHNRNMNTLKTVDER